MRKLRVVELYAGIARTWEAFSKDRNFELALLVDADQFAIDNYTDNHPGAPYWRRDLSSVSPQELLKRAGGQVDVLLGCPPCQGFSDTGKRDPNDPRNRHVSIFARFALALEPRAIVMENVPLLRMSPRFIKFTRQLSKAGYRWSVRIVNAALHGSCQTRQRLLLVAIKRGVGSAPRIPGASHGGGGKYFAYHSRRLMTLRENPIELLGTAPATLRVQGLIRRAKGRLPAVPTVSEVLAGLPAIGSADAEALSHTPWSTSRSMRRRMARVPEGGRWRGGQDHYSHAYGRLHRRGLAKTITTYFANPGSGRFWHPTKDRPLTAREAARIQGIEDEFLFHGALSKVARLIGNALDSAIANLSYLTVRQSLKLR